MDKVVNPLGVLCGQMALGVSAVAELAGIELREAQAALVEDSPFLAICRAIGVQFRVPGVRDFRFWLDGATVDSLFFDIFWRKEHGLLPAYRSFGMLWKLVAQQKAEGHSLAEICRRLDKSIVPTPTGLRQWHKMVISRMPEEHEGGYTDAKIEPNEECRRDFRSLVVSTLLSEICPDPFAAARYEMEVTYGPYIHLTAKAAIPKVIADQMLAHLGRVPWLSGRPGAPRWGTTTTTV